VNFRFDFATLVQAGPRRQAPAAGRTAARPPPRPCPPRPPACAPRAAVHICFRGGSVVTLSARWPSVLTQSCNVVDFSLVYLGGTHWQREGDRAPGEVVAVHRRRRRHVVVPGLAGRRVHRVVGPWNRRPNSHSLSLRDSQSKHRAKVYDSGQPCESSYAP
jgi:hypothetical protein